MAIFTLSLESAALGRVAMPYEIAETHMPKILKALAHLYGATVTEEDGTERAKTHHELLRNLTDDVMQSRLAAIQNVIEGLAMEEAIQAAREAAKPIPLYPGEPEIVAPAE